jgi:hypothetical protein
MIKYTYRIKGPSYTVLVEEDEPGSVPMLWIHPQWFDTRESALKLINEWMAEDVVDGHETGVIG